MKYKVRDIVNKMALLDREVNYLINKAKIWRPKQESITNHTESINETATNSKESDSKPESQTENLQNENLKSAEVQNEKSLNSEKSTESMDSSKNNEPKIVHKSEEEIHQEL